MKQIVPYITKSICIVIIDKDTAKCKDITKKYPFQNLLIVSHVSAIGY